MRPIAALVALLLWLACSVAFANEQRIALVIGNAAYRVDPLDNPVHDARLVAASLKQAAFELVRALPESLRKLAPRLPLSRVTQMRQKTPHRRLAMVPLASQAMSRPKLRLKMRLHTSPQNKAVSMCCVPMPAFFHRHVSKT